MSRVWSDSDKCVKLQSGCFLVFHNARLVAVEPEDPRIFTTHKEAVEYIDQQLAQYPGLDYYVCPVRECHHSSFQKHVRRL